MIGGTRYYYVTETGSVGSTVVPRQKLLDCQHDAGAVSSSTVTAGYSISTGDGNDRIDLSHQLVLLNGTIVAGDGADVILPGRGADSISGGAGFDLVTYEHRTAAQPVTVTIDDVANDGGSGEGDNVRTDVEYLAGGGGNDELTGSTGDNHFWGMAGTDTLVGNLGNDWLEGGDGNDTVWGSGGDDSLWGGSGDDSLWGHGGQDVLRGEAGNDSLNGGSTMTTTTEGRERLPHVDRSGHRRADGRRPVGLDVARQQRHALGPDQRREHLGIPARRVLLPFGPGLLDGHQCRRGGPA